MRKQHVRKTRSKTVGLPDRLRPWLFGRSFLNVAGRILRSKRQRRTPLSRRQVSLAERHGSDVTKRAQAAQPDAARRPAPRPTMVGRAQAAPAGREQALARLAQRIAARGFAVTLLVLLVLVIWGMLALAFHAVLPERFAYLTVAQLESIRSLLALLFASGLLSEYVRRLLSR